ncbi:MAG: extracellular solute-binding protein, partial [Oscillospiraceae bacterium]|nr:extracellular solute-binding protein [Oscillospiraceae bacterium]
MKKYLALVLALIMVLSMAACGGASSTPSTPNTPSTNDQPGTDAPSTNAGEPYTVKLSMATLMVVPSLEATQKVEDDINAYLKNTLGITEYVLDLTIVNIADYFTTIPMELAGGQGPDLVMMLDTMPSYVDSGYVIPLDQYLDNELKGTVEKIGNILNNGKING